MVKRKTIEERLKSKQKKRTNRDKLIQALKENDFEYLPKRLTCYACKFIDDYDNCDKNLCVDGVKLWLNQEVSDE